MSSGTTLVLGGTGFVGRNVLAVLREAGIPCVSTSRSEGTDLRNLQSAQALFRRVAPEFVVNCAAHVGSLNYVTEQAADVLSDNMLILLGMYAAVAAECPTALVINPIANCAYPATINTFEEDHWWDGHLHRSVLSYGSTRRMLWCAAECYQMQHGVRSVNFFVPNMYGPFDSVDPNKAHALNALVSKFVKAAANGSPQVEIWGTGAAIREWLYVGDFARVVLSVLRDPASIGLSEPINIGQNFGVSVRELVSLIAEATRFRGEVRYDHGMPDGALRKVMDDRRFRKVYPQFSFTPLKDGIAASIAYYQTLLPY